MEVTAWPTLLSLLFSSLPATSASCCSQKVVAAGDPRDGTYSLNGTSLELPVFCGDTCVYTRDGADQGNEFFKICCLLSPY